jgi:hypothetical protein
MCIVMCIVLFFDIKFCFKISVMYSFVGSYYHLIFPKPFTSPTNLSPAVNSVAKNRACLYHSSVFASDVL